MQHSVTQVNVTVKRLAINAILHKDVRAAARYDAEGTPLECMEGTRVNLIEDLSGRVNGTTPASSRITLVYGIPGSGKSTIAKTIATRTAKNGVLAASFFFSRNDTKRRELKLVFNTIAFQLAQYSKEYCSLLLDILEKDPDLVSTGPSVQLEKIDPRPTIQDQSDRRPSMAYFVGCPGRVRL